MRGAVVLRPKAQRLSLICAVTAERIDCRVLVGRLCRVVAAGEDAGGHH